MAINFCILCFFHLSHMLCPVPFLLWSIFQYDSNKTSMGASFNFSCVCVQDFQSCLYPWRYVVGEPLVFRCSCLVNPSPTGMNEYSRAGKETWVMYSGLNPLSFPWSEFASLRPTLRICHLGAVRLTL